MEHFRVAKTVVTCCEEARSSHPSFKNNVFCPKPRRLGQLMVVDPIRPVRLHLSHQADLTDSTAGADILDIILAKDSFGCLDQLSESHVSSSPPYFCGSPPSRAANPLVQDERFLEEKPNTTPLTPPSFLSPSSPMSPSSSARHGGCARPATKFGPKPAMVRIEGFDCLNRDSRGCGIPAVS